jgi:hypothetical protein
MILVRPDSKLIFVRGCYRFGPIREAVLEAIGTKRLPRDFDQWLIVGLADDDAKVITTGMPFSPPDDRMEITGFRARCEREP